MALFYHFVFSVFVLWFQADPSYSCILTFQVFDLGKETPDSVLHRLYLNLEKLKNNGDEFAAKLEERLRIIVSTTLF